MSAKVRSDNIAAALFGSVRQRVLGLLFANNDRSYYLREITRAVDAGHGVVQRELQQLFDCGLLTRTPRGNQVHYQANERSSVFPEVRGLIMKTVGLGDVLREALSSLADRIRVAFVYGSVGTHQAGSDVDLMVIGDVGLRQLSPLLSEAQEQLGREISPVTISPAELQGRLRSGDHFLTAVLQGPRIFLIGDDDELGRIAEGAAVGP